MLWKAQGIERPGQRCAKVVGQVRHAEVVVAKGVPCDCIAHKRLLMNAQCACRAHASYAHDSYEIHLWPI